MANTRDQADLESGCSSGLEQAVERLEGMLLAMKIGRTNWWIEEGLKRVGLPTLRYAARSMRRVRLD